jgi:hypothetical protein
MVWIDIQFHETISNCIVTWKHAASLCSLSRYTQIGDETRV